MNNRVVEEDAVLVERCLNGDETGMRDLVDRFQCVVFGLCLRMRSQRQDVAQEIFF